MHNSKWKHWSLGLVAGLVLSWSLFGSTIQQAITVTISQITGLGTGVAAALTANVSGTGAICLASGSACGGGGGSGTVTQVNTTSPIGGGPITTIGTVTCTTCTVTIGSGTIALATAAISSATCAVAQTLAVSGTVSTDTIILTFNADPTSTTGYIPSTSGMLTIIPWPTANTVNLKVCNNTSASITPGSATLNARVVR